MRNLLGGLMLVMIATGCATPYGEDSFMNIMGGYSETHLAPDVYRVEFKGNSNTDMTRAIDFTLLRCAELSLENGYPYFVIVDASQSVKESTYTEPTHSTTTANASVVGNSAYGTANTTTYGGQTYHYQKPRTTNTMLMLKDKSAATGFVYDAQFITNSLRSKYKLDKN